MGIIVTVVFKDKLYRTFSYMDMPLSIDRQNTADICIPNLTIPFSIQCSSQSITIRLNSSTVLTASLDEFVVLDEASQLIVFATQAINERTTYSLPETCELKVGRFEHPTASLNQTNITLSLPYISSHHFTITRKNDTVLVTDNGSKNGLFLNGQRIRSAVLRDGDVLSIYAVNIRFQQYTLLFENVGNRIRLPHTVPSQPKQAPKKITPPHAYMHSRSPRLSTPVEANTIRLEKPPTIHNTPQINWLSVLLMPAVSIAMILVLALVMGTNAAMLLISGAMSVVSAIITIINYQKQKKKHFTTLQQVEEKYTHYLSQVSQQLKSAANNQLQSLLSHLPAPQACLSIAKEKTPQLWNHSYLDEDFLEIRLGVGRTQATTTAFYQESALTLHENPLDQKARTLANNSLWIDNAPIFCNINANHCIGVTGQRDQEWQLARNTIVTVATNYSYEDVRIVVLAPESEAVQWNWARWLPHCMDNKRHMRYVLTTADEADVTLDSIHEILNKRENKTDHGYTTHSEPQNPHYLFIVATQGIVEKHPIQKHIFGHTDCGCSALFLYDHFSKLPKACSEIIELSGQQGTHYNRTRSTAKQTFTLDFCSVADADAFARSLAPLRLDIQNSNTDFPTSVSFLEGMGVNTPEELNIAQRWSAAQTYRSLSVPIAAQGDGSLFCFDIHEKRHGVNGIVAGMPGSGKTEMVQSWLLSLATHFSPQDVSFILIDFKGTGMIAPFKQLPHLAGSISNLDSNIDRNLIAIRSEVHRREALIDKYSDKNIKNVNDLNKAYAKGLIPERLPILLIVIDEYAEFKKNFPDFGNEIDSLTSKGRALGMFNVLMTQKPAGVVSAKSEDNIKFRWCLRVANYGASREMLGKPDAAKITNPGRAYIKVGEEDVYEQVQSFWSGAPYQPNRTKENNHFEISFVCPNGQRIPYESKRASNQPRSNRSEIDVVVEHITQYCQINNIPKAESVWVEQLPNQLTLSEVLHDGFDGQRWPSKPLAPVIGKVDNPSTQQQYPLTLSLEQTGHCIIYGAPVSGKTTLLQTLILSLAISGTPDDTHIYVMDFGGWNMNHLATLPHVGGIANDNDAEGIQKLILLLQDIYAQRRAAFSKVSVGNIKSYREATHQQLPQIVIAIDNLGTAIKMYPELDAFVTQITAGGANYGIYVVATALNANAIPLKISQNIKHCMALQLVEKSDYTYTVGKVAGLPSDIPGRGYVKGTPPLEFQAALPASGDTESAIVNRIKEIATAMNRCWSGAQPLPIPKLPDIVPYNCVSTPHICLGLSTDRVLPVCLELSQQHYWMISGTESSEKSNLLTIFSRQIKEKHKGKIIAFDPVQKNTDLQKIADEYLTDADTIDAYMEALRPELKHRYDQKQAQPECTFAPLVLAIDDYDQFFAMVSNDTISRLLAIIKIGEGLNVYLIVAGNAYELTALINKGESVALSLSKARWVITLGGCINDHSGIPIKAPFAQKSIPVNQHEGYLIHGDKYLRFKSMRNANEVIP